MHRWRTPARPLWRVCCRTPAGELIVTSVEDCARQGCRYFHIVADDLDTLLDRELNHRP